MTWWGMPMRVHTRRQRGELEHEVLMVLGRSPTPLPTGEVLDQLGRDLAYTTVMTTLVRLHDKGQVTRERAGRAYVYALADPPTVAARRMRRLLDTGSDREVVLARFLDELDPADVPVLERLLREASDD